MNVLTCAVHDEQIRAAQTRHTHHLCTLPHPFWRSVLTSNTVSPAAAAAAASGGGRLGGWGCANFASMYKDTG